MENLLEKTLMVEGWGKSLATAAATGIIGGAAMLGAVHKAEQEKPVESPVAAAPEVEEPNEPSVKKEIVKMVVTA